MSKKKQPKRRRRPPRPGLPEGPLRFFFFARQGFVQRLEADIRGDGVTRKCWPIAHTHEDANRLVDFFGWRDKGIRPAEIGTVDGETISGHFRLAFEEGCEFVIACADWTEEGKPVWRLTKVADIYPGPGGDR
jgi:hypothetical protein